MVYISFNRMSLGGVISHIRSETLASQGESTVKSEIIPNQELLQELYKLVNRRFEKTKNMLIFKRQYLGC